MEKRDVSLNPSRMTGAEFAHASYMATVEQGHTKEDLLNPNFWAHVAQKLRPYDEIKVRCDDDSFYATFLVLARDNTWAKLALISWTNLEDDVKTAIPDEYEIKLRGAYLKHCVIRKKDGTVIKEQCQTKKEAAEWLESYIATTGKKAA